MPPASGWLGLLVRNRGLVFPIAIVTSVLVILAPLPQVLMDLLLTCNITAAVIILLTTIYVRRPLEFSVFPAILLGTTLTRLVLNVATTRLILTQGATHGTRAAGGVIEAFGQFITGGQIAVGLIVFLILIAIQFLVITKGATRISEVAARFALDGMPGKQMAIDADLNAGSISQDEARSLRTEIGEQADFYAAMDGASKFVRGDAIASIVITALNILGGLFVGTFEHGMQLGRAAEVFTKLTIGDGLVTQVPAFLIALAAGLIVTRTSSESDLPQDMIGQVFRHPETMFLASAFLIALSFAGLPPGPMILLGVACAVIGIGLQRSQHAEVNAAEQADLQVSAKRSEQRPEDNLLVDPLELELGVGLIRLADPDSAGELLPRVRHVRNSIARELGIILPKVRIRDNIHLDLQQYQIKIRDMPITVGEVYPDGLLAVINESTNDGLAGLETRELATGASARWIETAQRDRAKELGYRLVEPAAAITSHLTEVVREYAAELLTRQQVHQLLDNLRQTSPKLIDELVPDVLETSQLHQILCNLLRERVPIRDLETILEILGDYAPRIKGIGILTEYARTSLARTICQQYRDRERILRVMTVDPALEEILAAGFDFDDRGLVVKLSPQVSEAVSEQLANQMAEPLNSSHPSVVLCGSPVVRAGLKHVTSSALPKLVVLSLNEISRDTELESVGQIGVDSLHYVGATVS